MTVFEKQRQAFEAALSSLAQFGRVPKGLKVHPSPLPVYVLQWKDVDHNASSLDKAVHAAWRFKATTSQNEVVAGDLDLSPSPQVLAVSFGATGLTATKGFGLVEEADPQGKAVVNPAARLLRIPGLLIEAIWIRKSDPADRTEDMISPTLTLAEKEQAKVESAGSFFANLPLAEDSKKVVPRRPGIHRTPPA